jgi:hypothetical protein
MLAGLLLFGCSAMPELTPRSGGNPMQVDLSGQWELQGGPARQPAAEQTIRIPSSFGRGASPGDRSRAKGPTVYVFLETGSSLKVTQTDFGLFFSFDRAIVEEYNFGEKRIVSVGPIEAQRVSGWDGRVFVAETMDRDGNLLAERWYLGDDSGTLIRDISISRGEIVDFESRQVFARN